MLKNRLASLLFLLPLTFLVACATLLDVDFGAAHMDDDASPGDQDGAVVGEGGKGSCQPKSCQAQGFECGTQNDSCGEAINCGTCKVGTCEKGKCACIPKTCPELKASCGKVDNGCGGLLDCGGCANPADACDGATNSCQCKPKNCGAQGAECGSVPDGCGQTYACGDCNGNPKGTYCTAGKCGATPCTPKTCKDLGKNCGQVSDGCSTVLDCGTCTGTDTCGGGGVANVCGCTAKTCAQLGDNCGTPSNGCGGALSCGSCSLPQSCGGGGTASVCGCTPTGKCGAGTNCGTVPDGCGANVACGPACSGHDTCGGGGVANVCGCTPLTCADYDCGVGVPNGCGGTLNCGKCGVSCFEGTTPVLMADGTQRAISALRPGDMIMGFDKATGAMVPRKVARLAVHAAEETPITIVLNGDVRTTPNHPFLSAGRSVEAGQLRVGDVMHLAINRGGAMVMKEVPITSVERRPGNIVTYDVTTSPSGGYIAGKGGIVVLQKL